MEAAERAQAFLQSLDPDSLKVGDGTNSLPVWIGVDAEAQKVYMVYANGLATGFGDGVMINRLGVGARAGQFVEQDSVGRHVMLSLGKGVDRQMELIEVRSQSGEVVG